MLSIFKFWSGSKSLDQHLNQTKKVKVRGVRFTIRRLRPLDYVTGAKVLTENYHTYEKKRETKELENSVDLERGIKKLKEHYREVFLACVVDPELSRKEELGKTLVDNIFIDMDLANELYMEIMIFTHGKKKMKEVLKPQP